MESKLVGEGITFDDVLLLPARSDVKPSEADVSTQLTRRIRIHIPICSAAMDTVTESRLAIAIAQEGGVGFIHRNLSIEAQAMEVEKVKRSEYGVIFDPVTLSPSETTGRAKEIMSTYNISGLPVVESGGRLVGILTKRDLRFHKSLDTKVSKVMTKDRLVTAPSETSLEEAKEILHREKVEKLLLTDGNGQLKGLITIKDISKTQRFPNASKDSRGRLRVGAAVGVEDPERADALVASGVDILVVDTAHGHSTKVIQTIQALKKKCDAEVIAGNVAAKEGAKDLIAAGADAIKVGIGPGSICTTRVVSGVGVPQVTAIFQCSQAAQGTGVPVIADGGVRHSGDITKAVAAGAHAVMLGGLLAGVDESPGEIVLYKGRSFKVYRGMGSLGSMLEGEGGRDRYGQRKSTPGGKLVPEGVEGRVATRGPLHEVVYQLVGGLKAGMGYCGTGNIEELRANGKFIRISHASLVENHPHNITVTVEAPNYSLE
ncbi:MAG: IMP dehydrogenase [Planctomycetota bacterium]|nr:IMP dehydrogenase [Planctomycetota bacterium]